MANAAVSEELERLLVHVAAEQDLEAFSELYLATAGRLFATVLLIVRQQELAEHILQKAYAQIWSQAGSCHSSSGSPLDWMIGIARNLARDAIRARKDEQHPEALPAMALPALAAASGEVERVERPLAELSEQERAQSAFTALSSPRRDLIVAAYLLGESKDQLARRSGVAAETVGGWLRGALLEIDLACREIPAGASHRNELQDRPQPGLV